MQADKAMHPLRTLRQRLCYDVALQSPASDGGAAVFIRI
jgi:hypothetical protein